MITATDGTTRSGIEIPSCEHKPESDEDDGGPEPNEDDGGVAGVDQCFMDGGDCASCCGACVKTTDLDNRATIGSCVCYEASTAPSGVFQGTEENDCVFIEADGVTSVYVRNQCLEGTKEVLALPRRGSRCSGRVESVRP